MSNIPNETKDSQAPVKEFFDNYFNETLTFPGADVDAVVGYFESRGFDKTSSISSFRFNFLKIFFTYKNFTSNSEFSEVFKGFG